MSLDEQFSPGSRVGNYEIMSKLGQGGMGGVFLVQQVFLKKRFALKVLNDELAAVPEFVEVFRHEAQMLATMKHPHIVQVHDFGMTGDRHYFVMDYIEGGTLEDFRKSLGGKLPPEEALPVLRSVASGLAHAHALGIVHRDLKPDNFLMDEAGIVKITDFGLARLARDPQVRAPKPGSGDTYMHFAELAKDTPEMTGGTEGFMAPEVKAGDAGDARSDIFALGVIARLLLTGRGVEVGMKTLAQCHPGLDPEWDRIVNRCLCADPADRYADGAALERDLDALAESLKKSSVRIPSWIWVFPAPLLSLSIFALLLALRSPTAEAGRMASNVPAATQSPAPEKAAVATPIQPLTLKRIREYGLKSGDAEIGYGLYKAGPQQHIEGWRIGSRAVWRRDVEPGRYRIGALYQYTPDLGAKPARLAVRTGDASLVVYIPASTSYSGEGAMRAFLGEIEVTSPGETVELELVEGPVPPGEAHLKMSLLVLEPASRTDRNP